MNPLYPLVAQRARHRCEYCGAPEAIFNSAFEVEHITPTSQDGLDDPSNCALARRSCNSCKSDRTQGIDLNTGKLVRLFNPRRDRWSKHFRVDPTSGAILGSTSIARATIATLQMNRPLQLAARQQWMLLGLFP